MRKRLILAVLVAAAVALLLPSVASANFAIHGNYVNDTDACAGCHRAHTSVSTITWRGSDNADHDALLTSSATQLWQFCYACHDATSEGADTNVQEGIYEGTLPGNTQFGTLNGGGFEYVDGAPVSSTHMYKGSSWGAYGGGYFGQGVTNADGQIPGANPGESEQIKMDCGTCHDPHGSPNYRVLKSEVFGNPVGGYVIDPTAAAGAPGSIDDPNPDGWVASVEPGWPTGGFRLHTEYPSYQPNYTTAMYAKGYNMLAGGENASKGMSGWCAGCHATYNGRAGSEDSTYNAGDIYGLKLRHRHPINVELNNYTGPDAALMRVNSGLPLDHDIAELGAPANAKSDWVECLTCHRAHGTSASMAGWADELTRQANENGDDIADFISRSGTDDPSALLRSNNRGVCEACHNK